MSDPEEHFSSSNADQRCELILIVQLAAALSESDAGGGKKNCQINSFTLASLEESAGKTKRNREKEVEAQRRTNTTLSPEQTAKKILFLPLSRIKFLHSEVCRKQELT